MDYCRAQLTRPSRNQMLRMLGRHLTDSLRHYGWKKTLYQLGGGLGRALRESLPDRRRARYGDLDFDFENSVDTTRSNTKFFPQFIAMVTGSPYFASEPWLFDQMVEAQPVHFEEFTFVDLGSGKGRALLMAARHPFRRIIGVEFMPDLNAIARQNIAEDSRIECRQMDARDFEFPAGPLVVYLFNPFPEPVFAAMLRRLECSWEENPRPVYLAYRSPEFESLLAASKWLERIAGNEQWAIYRAQ